MTDEDDVLHELPKSVELSQDVQALINNGLDFLEQAREELEASKPKPSLVSFWTAVEILLKVPLAHEHWSLVCSRKYPLKKQTYRDGDFQSISYDETRALLRDVLEKPLSDDTHNIFDKVRKHRNRLVHFFHPEFSASQMTQILNEQADAWFRLNQLIRKDWRHIFGETLYNKLTRDENRMLRTSHYYINAKFRSLGPRLKALRDKGEKITKCGTCGKKAGIHSVLTGENKHVHHETDCLVCGYVTELYLDVVCPNCAASQRIEQDGEINFICSHCLHTSSRYDLLDECTLSPQDQLIDGGPASCSDCSGYETVCEFGGGYLCTQCLVLHDSIGSCEYCGGNSTNIPDNSSLFGCEFCGGNHNLWDDD
ncbi:hsdR [Enterobacter hormaechei]|uniref:hsdR n=1 Tax=Enterobacter hormaechei TaxID=158836 RepID=UPI0026E2F183|nr:hsdR [Enterobacter hormaechei]MDO6168630.1 hsdR [Enterobacter hormaechei]MDO6172956.1 hsdR [Enterobacter hormaechei]